VVQKSQGENPDEGGGKKEERGERHFKRESEGYMRGAH